MFAAALFLTSAGCYDYHRRPDELRPEQYHEFRDAAYPRHPGFTQKKVSILREGMTTLVIERMFGPPDKTLFKTFYLHLKPPFDALVFEYDMGFNQKGRYQKNINTFFFDGALSPPRLVSWEIELAYPR